MTYWDASPYLYQAPKIAHDEVRGIVANAETQCDRRFYFLDDADDHVWEVDGYIQREGDREHWMLLICCPRCHNELSLKSTAKQFEITEGGIETGEPFFCTWPLDKDGFKGVCTWGAELQRPNKRLVVPVRTVHGELIQIRIDAIIRQARR